MLLFDLGSFTVPFITTSPSHLSWSLPRGLTASIHRRESMWWVHLTLQVRPGRGKSTPQKCTCLFMWSLLQAKRKWEALCYFKHEPRSRRYWKAKGHMWTRTEKRSINRHVFCCILTMMVRMHLLVCVVPHHSSEGADGVCWERTALQKLCLSPHSQILRAPKLGQAQSAGRDPFVPVPLALPKNHSQFFLFLRSPCKVPAVKDRPLGERDLFIPAHQRSVLPKAHVPT